MKRLFVALIVLGVAPAFAQMDIVTMQRANGLTEAIKAAKHCGYSIDQSKLEAYYVEAELDDPETLSFISSSIALAEFDAKPDASSCTMARITARKIGILGGVSQ